MASTFQPPLQSPSLLDCLVAATTSAGASPSSSTNKSRSPIAPLASVSSINPHHISPSSRRHERLAATSNAERGGPSEPPKQRAADLHHDIYRYSSPDVELDNHANVPGTAENPLIPKRRRRTSPAELAILEIEFAKNPLPSQGERSRIADRVGMTGRAAQVWFQNRRQKEKKDANTYHGGSDFGGAASSSGSAPDPDQDVSDLDAFTYSSSPVPAPSPPLNFGSSIPSGSLDTPSINPPPQNASIVAHPADSFSFFSSSSELYAGTAGNKENHARLPSFSAPALIPIVDESKPEVNEVKEPEPATGVPEQPPPIFVHRLATTSIITAKKHLTKRPLGSHAPLARQTSLSHNFDFPPSPVKGSKEDVERPTLRRQASMTSVTSTGSGAGGKLGGLFSLTTNESGRARVWVDALNNEWKADATLGTDEEQLAASAMDVDSKPSRTTLSALSKDEVWQHMASDPPSSFSPTSSPVPLTRKMMLALAAEESRPSTLASTRGRPSAAFALSMSNLPATSAARKTPLVRSHSLGGGSGSRAGGEETCAEMALGRKRARMGDDASSSESSSSRAARKSSGTSRKVSNGAARKRNANGLTVSTTLASSSSASEVGDSSLEMGELSFSSTSTAFSAEVGTPVLGKRALFGNKSSAVVGSDEERECAELLLGLGGSFF